MSRLRVVLISGLVITALLLMTIIAFLFLYPRAFIEEYASYNMGHHVSLGRTKVKFGHILQLDIEDIHVANATWAAEPDMLHVGHVTASLDLWALLRGKFKIHYLALDDTVLLLERNDKGVGNWKKSSSQPSAAQPPADEAAKSRNNFPMILDLVIRNSRIRMRTSSGATLKIDFKDLRLSANGENEPVILNVNGGYNDIPVYMNIATQPYSVLYDVNAPFGIDITAEGAATTINAHLALMDPINFDQGGGELHINIQKIGSATAFFSGVYHWDTPLTLQTSFQRNGDLWNFTEVNGALAGNIFKESRITLNEGKRKKPDILQMALNFEQLDVAPLIKSTGSSTPKQGQKISLLTMDENPGTLLDASLTAEKASYKDFKASHLTLHASLKEGITALDTLSMNIFGGTAQASFSANAMNKNNTLVAKMKLDNAEASQLLQAMHVSGNKITGYTNATLALTARGSSLQDIAQSTQGQITLSLQDGEIAKRLIWIASSDPRLLLGGDDSLIPISCMVSALNFTHGIGVLLPFEMVTPKATLVGNGTVNLPQQTLDLTFQTLAETTASLALDAPIHVTGKFAAPYIVPGLVFKKKNYLYKDDSCH